MAHDLSNTQDVLDVRDIIARVEELRDERDGYEPSEVWAESAADEADELASLEALLADLRGNGGDEQWEGDWYPSTLIHETYFVDAMKELVEDIDIGDMPNGLPSYIVVDWEATAENLRVDYTSTDYDGQTYWYR